MKMIARRAALLTAFLFTALLCMGVVYIDNVKHYFYQAGGYVQFIVNTNVMMVVDTNTLRLGINTTNTSRSLIISGRPPNVAATGNGLNGGTVASVQVIGGSGGVTTTNSASANGGAGGNAIFSGGDGGAATNAADNTIFGNGGAAQFGGGTGGSDSNAKATNSQTFGAGGAASLSGGAGGANTSGTAATNAVGGSGGAASLTGAAGGSPAVGWIRKPGAGGAVNITAGAGGLNAVRTNGAAGGAVTITAGAAGGVSTSTGDAGAAGTVNLVAGAGANGSGGTNSNGGSVYAIGGAPGTSAANGDVVLARDSTGTSRGGVLVGPATANAGALTNLLVSAATTLDFPSVGAMTETNLTIAVVNAAAGDIPTLSFTNDLPGGTFDARCSNGSVHVRFINYSLIAIDPPSSTFRVKVEKFR